MMRSVLPHRRPAKQIIAMPIEQARRWTAREVRDLMARAPRLAPRYELVDGELLVTPSPGYRHQEAVAWLITELRQYLKRERVGHALTSPSDIELEPEDIRQPDIFVVPLDEDARLRREGFPARQLLLAIEVLSPSTARFDRLEKRPGYQRHVPEYWIVDLDARLVERWRPMDNRPEILASTIVWSPAGCTEPLNLDLRAFFESVWS